MENNRIIFTGSLIFILVLLFIIPSVNSVPTTTALHEGSNGFEIEFPLIETVRVNQTLQFHFHVFNTSNGYPILNDSITCHFHLYNQTNSHIYRLEYISDIHDVFDYEVLVNGTNFSTPGMYSYIFQCNSSQLGGFVRTGFDVTWTGEEEKPFNNYSLYSILFTFLFGITLLTIAIIRVKKVWAKTVLALAISILVMTVTRFMSWFVSITNPNLIQLIDTMDKFYLFGVWGFRLTMIASVFILLIIVINVIRDRPDKKIKDEWTEWGRD